MWMLSGSLKDNGLFCIVVVLHFYTIEVFLFNQEINNFQSGIFFYIVFTYMKFNCIVSRNNAFEFLAV